ncbi:MAG: serine--tRNA ligase [Planctomycetes bacterium]|nr:serine--tRNA ligase [Planctomycetota bacterium]
MIDLKLLRQDPDVYRQGARAKGVDVDIDELLHLDEQRRSLITEQESKRADQKRISKEIGPQIGKLRGQLKQAEGDDRSQMETAIAELEQKPSALKEEIQTLDKKLNEVEPKWRQLWLKVPQPPDSDVPPGKTSDDNVELRRWNPSWFDTSKTFEQNQGFPPKTHLQLVKDLDLVDFERGVKLAGTRSYILKGDGARLHQAVLRLALDYIVNEHGFTCLSAPVLVREECMVGTGFFPTGRDQAYHIEESLRGAGHDLFLTGTGEVSLMGLHSDEILDESMLPLKYATVSTCFRREAGAAGKDTAGLYRVHQFDKVEQVIICRADEDESRHWHKTMIGIIETLMQRLELPHRLVQCCAGDLGPKNADMIDIEGWMPGRSTDDKENPSGGGGWGETHSASRLYDYQCRRLNMRYRDSSGSTVFCHSLNNTVAASPRILIPILEMYQNEDGSVTIPQVLRPYMNDQERIGSS